MAKYFDLNLPVKVIQHQTALYIVDSHYRSEPTTQHSVNESSAFCRMAMAWPCQYFWTLPCRLHILCARYAFPSSIGETDCQAYCWYFLYRARVGAILHSPVMLNLRVMPAANSSRSWCRISGRWGWPEAYLKWSWCNSISGCLQWHRLG